MFIISSLFIQRWPSSRFPDNTYCNNDCTVYFKFIFNFLISSQLCRTIHHCLLIEPSPICAFIDVLLSVEKPYILWHFRALHSIEINVASQNNDKIRIWIVIFCVISSEPAHLCLIHVHLQINRLQRVVTWLQKVVPGSRLQRVDIVVRMLHHIAIPLGDRVNGRNKEDIRLSYAKIFGIFEYKWQCAI